MARKRNPKKDKIVQISISLPEDLVKIVDNMAKIDNRNRSNFIVDVLKKLWKKFEEDHR